MPLPNEPYTYNSLSNEDKELLLAHGYIPHELTPEETRDLLRDLRAETGNDFDGERTAEIADENDGTDSTD